MVLEIRTVAACGAGEGEGRARVLTRKENERPFQNDGNKLFYVLLWVLFTWTYIVHKSI